MKLSFVLFAFDIYHSIAWGGSAKPGWRTATPEELRKHVLPLRAPVEKERIETEMRTASGIINSQGKVVAGCGAYYCGVLG